MRTLRLAPTCRSTGGALLVLGLIVFGPGAARAAGGISAASNSRLWLEGNSTLHKYQSKATDLQVSLEVAPNATGDAEAIVRAGQVTKLAVVVPVKGLRSGEDGLDSNMVKALRGDENPNITFRMQSYRIVNDGGAGKPFELEVTGTLQVAGTARPVVLHVQVTPTAAGLRVEGSQPLLMTDYKVQPPVIMLGMIRTSDEVTIRYDLLLRSGAAAR